MWAANTLVFVIFDCQRRSAKSTLSRKEILNSTKSHTFMIFKHPLLVSRDRVLYHSSASSYVIQFDGKHPICFALSTNSNYEIPNNNSESCAVFGNSGPHRRVHMRVQLCLCLKWNANSPFNFTTLTSPPPASLQADTIPRSTFIIVRTHTNAPPVLWICMTLLSLEVYGWYGTHATPPYSHHAELVNERGKRVLTFYERFVYSLHFSFVHLNFCRPFPSACKLVANIPGRQVKSIWGRSSAAQRFVT